MLTCKICKKQYKHLGSHLWHGHKMLSRDYKEEFGLPYNMSLITEEIKQKKQLAAARWKSTWKKNFENSKKYRFKKGQGGQHRTSEYEKRAIIKRIKNVNKAHSRLQQCPVCKIRFKHVESHLYGAHRLLKVK